MSRKWSRMVQKNQQQMNAIRAKTGQKPVSKADDMDVYQGKSIFLPILFAGVATALLATYNTSATEKDGWFWFTVVAYYLMALYFFFLRKPILRVGKSELSTRRLGRDKYAKATEIEYIYFDKNYISIQIRGKRTQWVYSKTINLFNMDAMKTRLREFAKQNSIKIVEK